MVLHPLGSLLQSLPSRRPFPLLQPSILKHLTEKLVIFGTWSHCQVYIYNPGYIHWHGDQKQKERAWLVMSSWDSTFSSHLYHWFMMSVPRNWADTTAHSTRMLSDKNTWRSSLPQRQTAINMLPQPAKLTKIIHLCYQALLQLLGESFKHKDATGVLHLQVAFKGVRRCLRFTWVIFFRAKSSLGPSSLLYDKNCSQQSSPVRSTPSLKHTQIYTSSKLFTHTQRKETKQSLHYIRWYSSSLDKTGEAGLSTLQLSTQQMPL